MKVKAGFPLQRKGEWPPYDVEHVWLEKIGELYKVVNSPFYLKGVANGDLLSVNFAEDGYVSDWNVISPSHNSTIWIIEHSPTEVVKMLLDIGCEVEREPNYNLISVSVPNSINYDTIDSILHKFEKEGLLSVAVPVDRMAS